MLLFFFLRKKNLITDGHYIVINIELTKMNMKNCVFIRKNSRIMINISSE